MTTYKAKAGANDINLYNGDRTFQRTTSSGGTLTVSRLGNAVDVLQTFGDGLTPSEAALGQALAYLGSNSRTLELAPGTWPITANLTTGAVTFYLRRGAVFSVDAGVTLDLSASYIIPEVETGWYTGAGTVTVTASKVLVAVDLATHEADTTTHGATGAVVGTTNTQNLENKTLITPTIASFVNANHTHADAANGGAVSWAPAKVSSNDTTGGYLNGKLVAGANITFTEGSDGGNETLTIAGAATDIGYAKNANPVTIDLAEDLVTLDCGTVVQGGLYIVFCEVIDILKGGTDGRTGIFVGKSSGTATVKWNGQTNVVSTLLDSWQLTTKTLGVATSALMEVTTGGTLVLKIYGSSAGSDASIGAEDATIRVVRIK